MSQCETALYPWQTQQWKQFAPTQLTVAHSILLTGPAGIGKQRFAQALAALLLCQHPSNSLACGHCQHCRWFRQRHHPDFRLISPDTESAPDKKIKVITVDAIRELNDLVSLSAHQGARRVVLILHADHMNPAAANAFLKILEEPPSGLRFILVSQHWQHLLPTIRSRCQRFPLPIPETKTALAWLNAQGVKQAEKQLAFAGGAPLAVLNEKDTGLRDMLFNALVNPQTIDVLDVAMRLERASVTVAIFVHWLQKWVYDLIALGLQARTRYGTNPDFALKHGAFSAKALSDYVLRLYTLRRDAAHPLNTRLVFETILFEYLAVLKDPDVR